MTKNDKESEINFTMTTDENITENGDKSTQTSMAERNQAWEHNHRLIVEAMTELLSMGGCWPTKTELAEETGLSLSTIYRHLEHFKNEDVSQNELEELKVMTSKITAQLAFMAAGGDTKAMRLAYELMGMLKRKNNTPAPAPKAVPGN